MAKPPPLFEVQEATDVSIYGRNVRPRAGSKGPFAFRFDLRASFDTFEEAHAEAVRIVNTEKPGPILMFAGMRKRIAIMQRGKMIWDSAHRYPDFCILDGAEKNWS